MAETLRYIVVLFCALILGTSLAIFKHAHSLAKFPTAWRTLLIGECCLVIYVGIIHTRELLIGHDSFIEDTFLVVGLTAIVASLFALWFEQAHHREGQ